MKHYSPDDVAEAMAVLRGPRGSSGLNGEVLDAMESKLLCRATAAPVVVGEDCNVARVRAKLLDRSRVGLVKYGVTTERGDLSQADWLRHLQEELMDAAVYIEAALAGD